MPPENPDNAHTISISVNAIRDHMDHGDYLDKCEEQTNESTIEEETEDNTEENGEDITVELEEELGLEQNN